MLSSGKGNGKGYTEDILGETLPTSGFSKTNNLYTSDPEYDFGESDTSVANQARQKQYLKGWIFALVTKLSSKTF